MNYMRLDAAQRTSTVVVDLDSHGERTFTFMVRPERRPVPSARGSPAVCRRSVAARLLHRSQRGAEPQHDIRGDGGDKARRGLCQLRPQYPQRPVAGSAGPSRLSRPGAGPRRRHKTFGRGAGVYQRQRRHRQRHRPAERPLPADAYCW